MLALAAPLWLLASLFLFSVQFALVCWNVCFVAVGLLAAHAIRVARRALRFFSCPVLPGTWATARKLAAAQVALRKAPSYEAWLSAATDVDGLTLATAWREDATSDEYNAQLVEDTTQRLREARAKRDLHALVFTLRTVMHRQYGGVDQPCLYRRALTGTKAVVEEYLDEVCRCLGAIASDGSEGSSGVRLSPAQKLEFFEQCRLQVRPRVYVPGVTAVHHGPLLTQVGRTALALSGGGALAMAHMGVVKCLLERGLLPRVIAGTSGGSIIAGMVGGQRRRMRAAAAAPHQLCPPRTDGLLDGRRAAAGGPAAGHC